MDETRARATVQAALRAASIGDGRRGAHDARSKTCTECKARLSPAILSWLTASPSVGGDGALWSFGCVRTLHVSECELQADAERQINSIRAATESMQEGFHEVRSELYAAQQLQRRHIVRGRRVTRPSWPSRRRGKKVCAVDVQVCEDGRGFVCSCDFDSTPLTRVPRALCRCLLCRT
jgi:hypothetical protein